MDNSALNVLILESSDVYYSYVKVWSRIIKDVNNKTEILKFDEFYIQLGKERFERYLLDYVQRNSVDVLMILDSFTSEFTPYFLERLRKYAYLVTYLGDIGEHFEDWYRYSAQSFDLVLSDSYYETFRFKVYNIDSVFFPSSFDVTLYEPLEYAGRTIDVSFVGCCEGKKGRKEYIEFLKENGIKIETFGSGSKNGFVSYEEMIEVFNRSKINLNFTGVDEAFNNRMGRTICNRINVIKGRPQEIALTKSFVLSEYANELDRIFDIGTEIDIFCTKDELLEKIIYYLENENLRTKMAERAYERAKREYNAVTVCRKTLDLIHSKIKEKKYYPQQIYIDDIFVKNIVSVNRAHYFIRQLRRKKFRSAFEEIKLIMTSGRFKLNKILCAMLRELMVPIMDRYPRIKKSLKGARDILLSL